MAARNGIRKSGAIRRVGLWFNFVGTATVKRPVETRHSLLEWGVSLAAMPSPKKSSPAADVAPAAADDDQIDPRLLLNALAAFKRGDFSVRLPMEWTGMAGKVADAFNEAVEMNERLARELARISRVVGKEGRISQRAAMGEVSGAWASSVDSINDLIGDLVTPTSEIARVIGAVAKGDLSQTMALENEGRPLQGDFLRTGRTVNAMVEQLGAFASEVIRVAREVGTAGKLGGQAKVKGVSGTWKDLTENVNSMAGNLTAQVRNIATVTTAVANGDLTKKVTVDVRGEFLELKDTINTMVDQLRSFASEVTRVAREVGSEGSLGGQARVEGVSGTWRDLTDSVNLMAGNLTAQVRNIAAVTTAVANGDLSKKITVDVKGEILELKNTINTMVDQLNSFASEVTRVAREVGTEGKLGGQADVPGVAGTWKDLTDNVNFMGGNLTSQVRGIARVVTAVANGDLTQKLMVDAKGEIAALTDTINGMTDTLALFADQVTTVAREVGVEGQLGGQANVPGAAGTWRHLTDNVNQLAANLTTQVRAIADVATAVTKGDLTRSISVAAEGEVASLKDNINEMIRNLKDTTLKNSEQDWLKTNLAKFTRMLQGQRDLLAVGKMILSELAATVNAQQGVFYIMDSNGSESSLKMLASYAFRERKSLGNRFRLGEGLVGQAALEKERILLSNVPGDYVQIGSGLGHAPPINIIVLPVVFEGQVKAVMELSSFERFSPSHQVFLDQLTESIGIVLNTIEANSRTEDLLKQSQSLATELQSRQEELQQTNAELEDKAALLANRNAEVEHKNHEVEQARQALEGKARQLSLTSKYKSEFLANMSHELRTPLNSLLILADQLAGNAEGNLTSKQVEFAKTILVSGKDLLRLINDILDLSKIESGTVTLEVGAVLFTELRSNLERMFRHVADPKGLHFAIDLDPALPPAIQTDAQRLDQVLKNLLSNAFKFTERGRVHLRVSVVTGGWSADAAPLNRAKTVIAFAVSDTGIGIARDKQQSIFEAFQQADGSTSRKFGGTGLGLAISREIARLLGGEIQLVSTLGQGSTFTFYLPQGSLPSWPPTPAPTLAPPAPAFGDVFSAPPAAETPPSALDDRASIVSGEATLLIVEDDGDASLRLANLAQAQGLQVIASRRGVDALEVAREFRPAAILLDASLPDLNGWKVLDQLKDNLATRHIPVCMVSADGDRESGLKQGAFRCLSKPLETGALEAVIQEFKTFRDQSRRLLVVEDDDDQRNSILELIDGGGESVQITAVATGAAGLAALGQASFDCLVLDLMLPDANGFQLIEQIRQRCPGLPIIVYTGKDLSTEEETRLNRIAQTVIVKDVRSPERLYDQTAFWLHREVRTLPPDRRALIERLHNAEEVLAGRKVLLVDDDMRNIFAMTSVLERYKMEVLSAETGQQAINILQDTPDIDVALMDIMLPEMDGYDTMRAIRSMYDFRLLPIIALTAKAMKGDREKCIAAGASDYIAKPVDTEKLLSLLRMWLHR
jgi:signal transduction histidine kinase/CheY-like chemotaxis protein/HAMP domain-containing protein